MSLAELYPANVIVKMGMLVIMTHLLELKEY